MGRFDDMDLTKVPSLSPLPDGVYIVRIKAYTIKPVVSNPSNEKIVWDTQVEEPAEAAQKVPRFFFDSPLSEGALFRLKNLAKAAGTLREGPFDPEELKDQRVGIVIAFENTKDYGPRSNITAFVKADNVTPEVRGKWEDVEEGATPAPAAATSAAVLQVNHLTASKARSFIVLWLLAFFQYPITDMSENGSDYASDVYAVTIHCKKIEKVTVSPTIFKSIHKLLRPLMCPHCRGLLHFDYYGTKAELEKEIEEMLRS